MSNEPKGRPTTPVAERTLPKGFSGSGKPSPQNSLAQLATTRNRSASVAKSTNPEELLGRLRTNLKPRIPDGPVSASVISPVPESPLGREFRERAFSIASSQNRHRSPTINSSARPTLDTKASSSSRRTSIASSIHSATPSEASKQSSFDFTKFVSPTATIDSKKSAFVSPANGPVAVFTRRLSNSNPRSPFDNPLPRTMTGKREDASRQTSKTAEMKIAAINTARLEREGSSLDRARSAFSPKPPASPQTPDSFMNRKAISMSPSMSTIIPMDTIPNSDIIIEDFEGPMDPNLIVCFGPLQEWITLPLNWDTQSFRDVKYSTLRQCLFETLQSQVNYPLIVPVELKLLINQDFLKDV